jgi:glycosyltransferase involved in cell wall biosynthesis
MGTRPRLIVAALVRNEADRFWRSALNAWATFADDIVVLDDGSTDDTVLCAEQWSGFVFDRSTDAAWGNEAPARAELWERACQIARVGDYIFILDADMVPARDPRPLLAAEPDAIAFPLYDLWSPNEYRCDGFWQGHTAPRTWCFRVPPVPADGWQWNARGVHCGHAPTNLSFGRVVYAPTDFSLLHYAYSSPALRTAKHAQYLSIADQLSPFERAHAESILDPDPLLSPLSFTPQYTLKLENSDV